MKQIKYDYFDAKVGQKYIVPCAVYIRNEAIVEVPLLGNFHKDPEFKENREHIHVDMRFYKEPYKGRRSPKNVAYIILKEHLEKGEYSYYGQFVAIENREMECLRSYQFPYHPKNTNDTSESIFKEAYSKFQQKHLGKTCKNGVCPHQGIKMRVHKDRLQCPLHGLVADKKTQKVIDYYQYDKVLENIKAAEIKTFDKFLITRLAE